MLHLYRRLKIVLLIIEGQKIPAVSAVSKTWKLAHAFPSTAEKNVAKFLYFFENCGHRRLRWKCLILPWNEKKSSRHQSVHSREREKKKPNENIVLHIDNDILFLSIPTSSEVEYSAEILVSPAMTASIHHGFNLVRYWGVDGTNAGWRPSPPAHTLAHQHTQIQKAGGGVAFSHTTTHHMLTLMTLMGNRLSLAAHLCYKHVHIRARAA